tara:strand:- start:21 stop:221 length:201 start_codon:yes stop_codon:yes gene_type:complete
MKKVFTVLLLSLAMYSCTPEDQCGTVTAWDIDADGNYNVYIDGTKHNVMASTWYDSNVGDYLCLRY